MLRYQYIHTQCPAVVIAIVTHVAKCLSHVYFSYSQCISKYREQNQECSKLNLTYIIEEDIVKKGDFTLKNKCGVINTTYAVSSSGDYNCYTRRKTFLSHAYFSHLSSILKYALQNQECSKHVSRFRGEVTKEAYVDLTIHTQK